MTDEQRNQVDALIKLASVHADLGDYEANDRCASYLADIRCLGIAIAIMLRDMLDKPKDDGWWKCPQCRSEMNPARYPSQHFINCPICGAERP